MCPIAMEYFGIKDLTMKYLDSNFFGGGGRRDGGKEEEEEERGRERKHTTSNRRWGKIGGVKDLT